MTTTLKVEANRHNALASTGPQTAEGKAIISCNAIRHGLLSWKPVIPGFENAEDWETHLKQTFESLAPVGYAENVLAERAALLLWRLSRVGRYERDATAIALEQASARTAPKLNELEESVMEAQELIGLVVGLKTLPGDREVDLSIVQRVLKGTAKAFGEDLFNCDWPAFARNGLGTVKWTIVLLQEFLATLGQGRGVSFDEVITLATTAFSKTLAFAQRKRDDLLAERDWHRRDRLLPDQTTMERVSRYETTLERSLYKALHELERRQAARAGQPVPLPVAVDVNVSGPAQE